MRKSSQAQRLFLPKMGFGSAPIGNLYREISDTSAVDTIHYALENGVTLLDTAPLYGLGLAEERLGLALADVPRARFTVSTKIGRLLNADRSAYVYDYSYDGIMRSLEGSLARLGLESVDILHIHEADPNTSQEDALTSAFPTMLKLREEGIIKAIGAGMNEWTVLEKMVRSGDFDFDYFLLAGRYTLLEQGAFDFLKLCENNDIGILAAGVYNSGILATGANAGAKYNYASVPPEILTHAKAIESICKKHNVPLHVAAMQFVAAHSAITSLVVGAESPTEIEANLEALDVSVPVDLWAELLQEGLIAEGVPVPD